MHREMMVWERIEKQNSDIDEEVRISGTIIPESEEKQGRLGYYKF
jgi:hypothetical protein